MATNYITTTILHNSKIIAANDWSIHNNERIKCDNIYQPSLTDSSANWKNSKNHSSVDTFEPAKVAAENDQRAVDATILLEFDQTMKKQITVLEGVSAQLTQLETRIHHLESSMNDLKVSVRNNHGITDGKLTLFENILREIQNIQVQNVKEKQDIVQAELQPTKLQVSKTTDQQSETQTTVMSNLVQQASSVSASASAPLQSQKYLPSPISLPQSIHVVSPPNAPPQQGLPPPPQMQSSIGHHLEEQRYVPSQNYLPNLHHPLSQPCSGSPPPQQLYGTLPQGYEPPSSISGAIYSSGYGTLSGPAEPNRYGRPPQYGRPPRGYEPPSSRYGASYSSRYDTLSEIAEPNRYGGPPQYGGKQPQLHTASVAYISGSGYPQLPTAHVLPQAIPTESAVSVGSGSPEAGNRVSVDHVVEKVATLGFPRDHVRAMVRKLTENILILLFLYHLFLFLG